MRWHMPPRLIIVAAFVVAVITLWPSSAHAGTYDVYSCRLPDGSSAPVTGWSSFGTAAIYAANGCASGGALTAELPSATLSAPVDAGWLFRAPTDTSIRGAWLRRSSVVPSSSNGQSIYYFAATFGTWPPSVDSDDEGLIERCLSVPAGPQCDAVGAEQDPDDVSNELASIAAGASELIVGVGCHRFSGDLCWQSSSPGSVRLRVFASRLTLEDTFAPEFSGEPVILDGSAGAPASVAFVGIDRGSGVASATLKVDDRELSPSELLLAPPCPAPYTNPVPCPLRRELVVPLAALGLAPGEHTLQAVLSDAAGNGARSKVVRVTVPANPPTLDAVPSLPTPGPVTAPRFVRLRSWFAGKSRVTQRTLKFGQHATMAGVLTDAAGVPVASAALRVDERPIGAGARARPSATVRTDAKGRFSYRLRAGSSRLVEVSYRTLASDPAPVAVARVTVRVRAGVTLRTSTKRVRNGTALRFSGRVLGERGIRRAIVTIYALARGPRPRIPVETVRARSDGRFSYTYRFGSITGPSVYRFEARVPKQTGFPYLEGASRRVTVHGRP